MNIMKQPSSGSTMYRVVLAIACLSAAFGSVAAATEHVYVTWAGAEPDKGACAWYIKRIIDPHARFEVVPHGSPLPEGVPFDVPQSSYRRTHNASAFQMLLREYPTDDAVIERLAGLMHDVEINLWRPKVHAETDALIRRTREIEAGFGTGNIPMACFVAFFDEVYDWLRAGKSDAASLAVPGACQASAIDDSGEAGERGAKL